MSFVLDTRLWGGLPLAAGGGGVSLLLRVDRPSALYALRFPECLLTRREAAGLLLQRGVAGEVDWGRVACVKDAVVG